MLDTIKIISKLKEFEKVEKLYLSAFPENERGPLMLLLDDSTKCSEVFAFYDNEIFVGFAALVTYGDISHILYFAMVEELRGSGYGSKALKLIKKLKQSMRIIADIEAITTIATNNIQREKRKQFYLKNGFSVSDVAYEWENDQYEIVIEGGEISSEEFWGFWENVSKINADFTKF